MDPPMYKQNNIIVHSGRWRTSSRSFDFHIRWRWM